MRSTQKCNKSQLTILLKGMALTYILYLDFIHSIISAADTAENAALAQVAITHLPISPCSP